MHFSFACFHSFVEKVNTEQLYLYWVFERTLTKVHPVRIVSNLIIFRG